MLLKQGSSTPALNTAFIRTSFNFLVVASLVSCSGTHCDQLFPTPLRLVSDSLRGSDEEATGSNGTFLLPYIDTSQNHIDSKTSGNFYALLHSFLSSSLAAWKSPVTLLECLFGTNLLDNDHSLKILPAVTDTSCACMCATASEFGSKPASSYSGTFVLF